MRNLKRRIAGLTAVGLAMSIIVGTASAETTWQKNHPRRTQVNSRLADQNHRIHQDVKDGTLTRGQAATLHNDDHQIRQEERDMASQNGSHITKSEDHVLNQQENSVGSQIPPK
jgi:hypothetical protein